MQNSVSIYSCVRFPTNIPINLSLIPAMFFQLIVDHLSLTSIEICFVASPIISRLRTIALFHVSLFIKLSFFVVGCTTDTIKLGKNGHPYLPFFVHCKLLLTTYFQYLLRYVFHKIPIFTKKSIIMSTIELRHYIIEKLSHIDDDSFLKAIKTIVETKVNEGVYKLSDFQKKRVESGREQLRKGQSISNDVLQKEIDQWLNTK